MVRTEDMAETPDELGLDISRPLPEAQSYGNAPEAAEQTMDWLEQAQAEIHGLLGSTLGDIQLQCEEACAGLGEQASAALNDIFPQATSLSEGIEHMLDTAGSGLEAILERVLGTSNSARSGGWER